MSNSALKITAGASISTSYAESSSFVTSTFTKGGSVFNATGITTNAEFVVWNALYPSTLIKLSGYRSGGSTSEINAYKIRNSTVSKHTGSNLVLTSSGEWMSSNDVSNTSYIAGDSLVIAISGSVSAPTQIAVQLDFTKP